MTDRQTQLLLDATFKPKGRFAAYWNTVGSFVRRYRNRREVYRLLEFTDNQLADIGLQRDDVRYAVRGGAFDDYSNELTRAALRRRSRRSLPL
ncbi:DUF1127 domain-containing protein [Hoeflea sp. CAU 1731]